MKKLIIGDMVAEIPVIQGGMGVGISLSGLAGAVAKHGGIGVISAAQIGYQDEEYDRDPVSANLRAIETELIKAREIAGNNNIGVNIMVATRYYEKYVKQAVKAGAALIISGAGLPMELPGYTKGTKTKIAPIVSSKKAASIIIRQWEKKYQVFPDLVVIEGPLAGGHLGFSRAEIDELCELSDSDSVSEEWNKRSDQGNWCRKYDREVKEIIDYIREVEKKNQIQIPVVVGGGIFLAEDMKHYMGLGADGVQVGTRFVATEECDASDAYKQAYINAQKEDIVIIKSPVGMPARAIKNRFLDDISNGKRSVGKCCQCIKKCDSVNIQYCIAKALTEAVTGNMEEGLIFCGANVDQVNKIETVGQIMEEFSSWELR